jgi:hypothetical protein
MSDDTNINTPPTDAEVDEFIANLSETDKAELKRQQLVNRAVSRQPDKAVNLGRLTDAEFSAYKRSLGMP